MQEEGDGEWWEPEVENQWAAHFDFVLFMNEQLRRWLGHPWTFYGTGLNGAMGISCSQWVHVIYAEQGLHYPYENTWLMVRSGTWTQISRAPRGGDLVIYDGHVAMYIGLDHLGREMVVSSIGGDTDHEVMTHPIGWGGSSWTFWEWSGRGESDS